MGGPDLTQRDPDPIQGTQYAYLGVPDRIRGSRLCVQRSDASSCRSGPTDCILGYIIFSGHVVPLEPSTRWGRVLFTVRLEIVARAPYLHTVVKDTPDSGYRQTPSRRRDPMVCLGIGKPPKTPINDVESERREN
jgi:hypothetical protein